MKLLRYFSILFILSTPSVAFATPTQYGESGLISVPTTEVTGLGSFQLAAWVNNSQNNGNMFTLLPISLSMGFSEGMELFVSYPNVLLNPDNDGSGRGYENLGVKFRLTGGTASKFRSTVDGFIRQAISVNSSLNGLKDSGARLMMSYNLLRNTLFHLNIGWLKVSSPQGMDYKDETLFGGAIEFTGSERLRPFIEVDGNTRREGGSPRIEVSPGIQYYLLSNLSATIGGGYGTTSAGPDYRVVAGLIFESGTGRYIKAIPVIPGSREKYAETTVTPEELMPEIPATPQAGSTNKEVTLPGSAPVPEGIEISQPQPSDVMTPDIMMSGSVAEPTGKDLLTTGAITTSAGMAPLLIEPGMPVLKTMPAEKAATSIEKASLKPETPAELPSVTFAPPVAVGKGVTSSTQMKPETKGVFSQPDSIKVAPPITTMPPAVAFAPPMPVGKGIAGSGVKPEAKTESSPPETAIEKTQTLDVKEAKAAPSVPATTVAKASPPVTTAPPSVAFAPPLPSGAAPALERQKTAEQQPLPVPPTVAGVKVKKRTEMPSGEHKIVLQSDIMFAFNKSEIAQSGEKILNELSEEIKNDKGTILEVKLEGHTDNIGNAGYNRKLSLKRAKSVKAYLIRRGIKAEIITVEGFGYERPVASNETPEGRDKNRRVDMTINYLQILKSTE